MKEGEKKKKSEKEKENELTRERKGGFSYNLSS